VLRELGYHVTVHDMSPDPKNWAFIQRSRAWIQIAIGGGRNPDYPSAANFYDTLLSCAEAELMLTQPDKAYNGSLYCNPALDRLAAHAYSLELSDPSQARLEWVRVDHQATDNAPMIFTDNPRFAWLVSGRVKNYQTTAGLGPLYDQLQVQ
jgi:hypothetical protein